MLHAADPLGLSRASGLPMCSVWADQPFWATRLEQLGAGVHVPFRRLDRSTLESGLHRLLSDTVRERAAVLGDAIRAEGDGTERAAQLLDEWLLSAKPTIGVDTGRGRTRLNRVPA